MATAAVIDFGSFSSHLGAERLQSRLASRVLRWIYWWALWHRRTSDAESRHPPGGNQPIQIESEHCALQVIRCKRVEC